MSLMENRIYRSNRDIILGGVCAGVGEYFDIDPTIVRIIWAIAFFSGFGFLAYIIAWIVIPRRPFISEPQPKAYTEPSDDLNPGVYRDEELIVNDEVYMNEENTINEENVINKDRIYNNTKDSDRSSKIIGIGLIVIGAGYLAKEFFRYINIDDKLIFSVLFIVIGLALIIRKKK